MKPEISIRGDSVFISGYANITEKESSFISEHGRTFKEIILPNAFKKSLQRAKEVLLLLNHDNLKVLGSTSSGVRMYEDEIGLKIEADIKSPDIVQRAKENPSSFDGWSFGFFEKASEWLKKDGYDVRKISDLDLIEVSLLNGVKPAYPSAKSIEVRSEGMLERRYTMFENEPDKNIVDLRRYENQIKLLKLKECYF